MPSNREHSAFHIIRAKWEAAHTQEDDKENRAPASSNMPGRLRAPEKQEPDTASHKVRRFSSITSFASPLNPFNRRRQSTIALQPETSSTTALLSSESSSSLQQHRRDSRRSSLIPLPTFRTPPPSPFQDPDITLRCAEKYKQTQLPRSHTMSNIPALGSTARPWRNQSALLAVLRHASSKPDPYARKVFAQLGVPTHLQRSTTQPNLHVTLGGSTTNLPRKAVFKEEFEFATPRRPWKAGTSETEIDGTSHRRSPRKEKENVDICRPLPKPWESPTHGSVAASSSISSSHPSSLGSSWSQLERPVTPIKETWYEHLAATNEQNAATPKAHPGTLKEQQTPVTVQRWKGDRPRPSLPRLSSGHPITQHQLLQPLSPPLPRTPGTFATIDHLSAKVVNGSRGCAGHRSSVRRVTQAQPNGYWAGRFTTLHDQLLDASHDCAEPAPEYTYDPITDVMVPKKAAPGAGERQAWKVFEQLYEVCVTDEARSSLCLFARTYGRIHNMPSILWSTLSSGKTRPENKEVTPSPTASLMTENKRPGDAVPPRKMSFMERLMGKNRKSSGQSLGSEKSNGK
ncbi:hypothetical protein H2199_000546 [Coniosporium tulheliwenetii]|uniref:Uncharacterized protein n=1 Tax=Coniosporium tulheliwenetii TaxID=3383036 RepID=A0ACC2ZQI1_9PEZI|nr:hypothetical protein H2199_000546 [Cladosporium sp. JES 115]